MCAWFVVASAWWTHAATWFGRSLCAWARSYILRIYCAVHFLRRMALFKFIWMHSCWGWTCTRTNSFVKNDDDDDDDDDGDECDDGDDAQVFCPQTGKSLTDRTIELCVSPDHAMLALDTKHLAGSLTAMPVGPTNWPAIYDHSSRPLFTPNTWARGFHMIGHRQFIPIYNHSPRPTELALSAAFGIPLPHKRAILIGIRSNELA